MQYPLKKKRSNMTAKGVKECAVISALRPSPNIHPSLRLAHTRTQRVHSRRDAHTSHPLHISSRQDFHQVHLKRANITASRRKTGLFFFLKTLCFEQTSMRHPRVKNYQQNQSNKRTHNLESQKALIKMVVINPTLSNFMCKTCKQ